MANAEIKTVEERVIDNGVTKIEPAMQKVTSGPINAILSVVVPSSARKVTKIQQKLNDAIEDINEKQKNMIEGTSKRIAHTGVKLAAALPLIGNAISLGSAVDNGIAAVRQLKEGVTAIKDRITTLRDEVKDEVREAKRRAKCGLMQKMNNLKSKMPNIPKMGFGKTQTQTQKGGSLRKSKNKINYSQAERALHRTRRSIDYFQDLANSKKHMYSLPTHLKTRKLYANKILDRTSKSVSAFSG